MERAPGPSSLDDLETPALLMESDILLVNLRKMQEMASSLHVDLRPHVKAHKMAWLASRQVSMGACGITASKVSEAQAMVDRGLRSVLIANEVVGASRSDRLHRLAERAEISCCVDDLDAAKALSKLFEGSGPKLSVLIEVDTGLKRCGLSSEAEVRELAVGIQGMKGLELEGILTHAGHAYSARSPDEVEAIGRAEGEVMAAMADGLRSKGIGIKTVSVGSTPTVKHSARVKGVTEVRPGNYVFNDMTQVALGVVPLERCSLTVLSTVISKPAGDRLIIDAGSKTLSSDRGAHGTQLLDGFGFVPEQGVWLSRLSEEHGIIDGRFTDARIGDRLRIVPNHACTAVNLFDRAYLVKGEKVLMEIPVDARGHSI